MIGYIGIAIGLLIIGHICKICRWKQLIAMYEEADTNDLTQAIVLGQAINLIAPLRIGDIARIWAAGRKLKNGYALSLATVFADLYMDTLTVGAAFLTLYGLDIHRTIVFEMMKTYIGLSIAAIILTSLVFVCKKYVKKIIHLCASVFNSKIELNILYITYATFASLKNIFKKVNFIRVTLLTCGMWGAYFASYNLFAKFMQLNGNDVTLTEVFSSIFSTSGYGLYKKSLWYFLYLCIPLLLLGIWTIICRANSEKMKSVQYIHLLPQLNENEKLAFLEMYFSKEEKREYLDLYLKINRDINIIRDYSAGSNATTMLCMDGETTFFRKYALAEDAIKLNEQILWLEKYRDDIPVTNIIKKVTEEQFCYYDMEYYPQAVGFFEYIHTMPVDSSWSILQSVLETLRKNIHSKIYADADSKTVENYVNTKVNKNMDLCLHNGGKWLKALNEYDSIFVNGVEYPNLRYYTDLLNSDNLIRRFKSEKYSAIHGDLTVENIVCRHSTEEPWYLIDPNTGSLHESSFLDYAKLLQSLHGGYEFLMMVKDVSIEENKINFFYTKSAAYGALYKKYLTYLCEHFTKEDVITVFLHEAIHWLRLMPYKIRKNPKQAVVFYAGMLIVLQDINEMVKQGDKYFEKIGIV